jgi:alpha-galactosidase
MGVDTWYGFWANINEATIVRIVDSAASDGLRRAGYRYVWINAGWWEGPRNADGSIAVDPAQWPHGMAWLASYIHAHGFRAGIYEETGDAACYNGGALGHVQQDVDTFARWGFDALKADYCGDEQTLRRSPGAVFGQFAWAIRDDQPHRPMILNACDPDIWDPYPLTAYADWTWGPKVATAWRTGTDLTWPGWISWAHVLRNIDADAAHPRVAGHGHWNDPDYLAPSLLPQAQAQAQFSMWAILAAPMMVSADVSTLSTSTLAMLTNPRVLAISQDPLGVQGRPVAREGQLEVWVKPLADHSVAVAILNRDVGTARARVTARMIGIDTRRRLDVLHVWSGQTTRVRRIRLDVPGEAAALLRVRVA